jgi:hypothetical protein
VKAAVLSQLGKNANVLLQQQDQVRMIKCVNKHNIVIKMVVEMMQNAKLMVNMLWKVNVDVDMKIKFVHQQFISKAIPYLSVRCKWLQLCFSKISN